MTAECYQNAQPGDIIPFGMYTQNADGADRTPILWRVLRNTGSELFVLSESILDCKRYHGRSANIKWRDCVDMTWRDCDLRAWLNNEFYTAAFNAAEKDLIKTAHCADNGAGTPDTQDRVYLLSAAEAKEFSEIIGKDLLRAVGTDYANAAKPDGCRLGVYDKSKKNNYAVINGQEVGCSWWWLRTQGNKPSRAYFIGTDFSIRSYGNNSIAVYGVRPGMRISF